MFPASSYNGSASQVLEVVPSSRLGAFF